ncbi:rhodanese-like domain-containing protein [Nonlabens marinus]|uniref:Rhodanese-like domain protein n=1 Tax=Nonlabens marinus S1-08 TaxID=1454201 RepID=W8VPC8_9FLAO|nr:rhodanese-like domain-containing protein [Nonlabens marinus]BAO54410.1 rhodanese-like domain protein [Nonlabens marinus S1-08]
MRLIMIALFTVMCSAFAKAQSIDSLLKKYNSHTVPYISVEELAMNYSDYTVLDTRKKEEFEVSHLPNAIWVGENWQLSKKVATDAKIVVYCSVGVRSEDYGEQLQEAGYTEVKNLYGSIFAWKNAGFEVLDNKEKPTEKVHTYSKTWAKYLKSGIKVY